MTFAREGRRVVWDEALLRALFDRAVRGEATERLAAAAGVSGQALRLQWQARGWMINAAREARMRALFERFAAGEATADIASAEGLSRSGLLNAWSRLGLYLYPPVKAATVRELWRRHLGGERTADLAAEHGRSRSWLAMRWRRLGLNPAAHKTVPGGQRRRDNMYRVAWGRHVDGASWREIADEVGYRGTPRALRLAVRRWRIRVGIAVPDTVRAKATEA